MYGWRDLQSSTFDEVISMLHIYIFFCVNRHPDRFHNWLLQVGMQQLLICKYLCHMLSSTGVVELAHRVDLVLVFESPTYCFL